MVNIRVWIILRYEPNLSNINDLLGVDCHPATYHIDRHMAAKIVPFGLSRPQAEALIHELAADSNNLVFIGHFRERLRERRVSMRQVMLVLEGGSVIDGPTRDEFGEWRCTIRKRVAGQRVHVGLAISSGRATLTMITVY